MRNNKFIKECDTEMYNKKLKQEESQLSEKIGQLKEKIT